MSNENQYPQVWWKPVTQNDYAKIGQIGQVTTVIRILPGFANGQPHEAVFEKNTSTSHYPGSKKWVLPVLIMNDMLHPENNGKVAVMDITKTLKNKIQGKSTPPNYYDLSCGFNFNVVVSLQQSNDGNSTFPNYNASHYDNQPSAVDQNYVFQKMNEMQIVDFADWVMRLNEGIARKAAQASTGYGGQQNVAPQAASIPANYNVGQPVQTPQMQPQAPVQQPMQQQPVQQPVQASAPPAVAMPQPVPQQPMQQQPMQQQAPIQAGGVPWEAAPTPPQNPAAQPPQSQQNGNFDNIFATPNENDVPF